MVAQSGYLEKIILRKNKMARKLEAIEHEIATHVQEMINSEWEIIALFYGDGFFSKGKENADIFIAAVTEREQR